MAFHSKIFRSIFLVAVLAALPMITSCATSRGTLALDVQSSANPNSGPTVQIVSVTDQRKFELKPSSPATPSLRDGQIHDQELTTRAIARKRNGYGMALGDIVLEDGSDVETLIRNIVTQSLRQAGYRVLEADPSHSGQAVPLEVEIEKFWAWFQPGFWAAHLEFESQIKIFGPIAPFENGQVCQGHVRLATQAASSRAWRNAFNKGIADLQKDIERCAK